MVCIVCGVKIARHRGIKFCLCSYVSHLVLTTFSVPELCPSLEARASVSYGSILPFSFLSNIIDLIC